MKQGIRRINEQNQPHGYWEVYFSDGRLSFKGEYINGVEHGYFLEYWDNAYHKFYYKNGNRYYKNRCVYYDFETF